MRIIFYNGLGAWWGEYPLDVLEHEDGPTVAGGEAAFLQTAYGLSKLGHTVVACHPGQCGTYRGVRFRPRREFDLILLKGAPPDAVVSWSYMRALRAPGIPPTCARLFAQQLNDLWQGLDGADAVVSPSTNHVAYMKNLAEESGLTLPPAYVSGAGVTCEYPDALSWPREPVVGYWSSPDRGLAHILRVWPAVKRAVPTAQLRIFYEIDRWIATCDSASQSGGHAGWFNFQASMVRGLLRHNEGLGVSIHGALSRKALARHQQECRIWCYPLDNGGPYVEGFSVAMLEALAAGCYPIARLRDALPTVYEGAKGDWIENEDDLREALIERLVRPPSADFKAPNLLVASKYTWERATLEMEKAIEGAIRLRREGG